MRFLRLAPIFAAALLVGTAHAATGAPAAPIGLHGFMLQANEQQTPPNTFARTPSFAWSPVPGAIGYQFQLSTSSVFRDNGTVYNTNTLTTPVVAPAIVLPWITGSPHSLYARVRATTADGISPWSAGYGFDMLPGPPGAPTPLPSQPGLLRWTTVDGATGYQVWLIDVTTGAKQDETGKKETVRTNVLDEREFYTFHQSQQWIGKVRWRVRAIRSTPTGPRNGLPVASYAAWSPIYSSSNTAPKGGGIVLGQVISDVVSDGKSNPSHELMPGFTWTGNQSLSGAPAELFRVYVFTDKLCLNTVFTSAVIGSPAYAPRPFGPLSLPEDPGAIANARSSYLPDGTESGGEMYDGTAVTPQEQAAAATPTTTAPADDEAAGPPSSSPPAPAASSGSVAASAPASGSAPAAIGAPVDLWDTYNIGSGYYWTVVPVSTSSGASGSSTIASPGASKGSTLVPVTDAKQFAVGESITIGVSPNTDTANITAIGSSLLTISTALGNGHSAGDPIKTTTSNGVVYRDMDIPQDACKAGRISQFGIASEATVTSADAPFATGLSATGTLQTAAKTSAFYGRPLVAWTPALAAQMYEVEWSAKAYPFVSLGNVMTTSTSTVLPLGPGTWYYRVRGFDYNMVSVAQQMAWFDPPEKLVIAAPTFQVAKTTVKGKTFKVLPSKKKKSSAPTTLVLRFTVASASETEKDLAPKGPSAGDTATINYKLKNVDAQLGRSAGALVGSGRDTVTLRSPSSGHIDVIVALPGGTLSFSGDGTTANPATSLSVTTGTGSFAGARGTLTSTKSVITYSLTLPGA